MLPEFAELIKHLTSRKPVANCCLKRCIMFSLKSYAVLRVHCTARIQNYTSTSIQTTLLWISNTKVLTNLPKLQCIRGKHGRCVCVCREEIYTADSSEDHRKPSSQYYQRL